ncbi:ABC transporter permease [Arenimonas terrae]|uniref:ABC transporter permease n=1 Tax=Arenimonas terrae TaxID=2546226 RepID=A0A5C4RSP4_9GAMM|nr:ABC transporter permease [Arenimonas terrae]TNJ34226.1 hypothetical protein E1B00_00070 [Arenimonas terrae]
MSGAGPAGAPATPPFPVALWRTLHAERLKLRGTLALWMCVVAPALVVAVVVLQLVFSELGRPLPPEQAWTRLSMGVLALWSFLMLPLFVTLEAALLAQLEHGGNQWRRLLALPLPREVHYLAKLIALFGLLAAAQAVVVVLIPVAGAVLMLCKPGLGLAGAAPWPLLLAVAAKGLLASLLVVALHTWIALRWRSFAVACGTGMGATVMGFLIGQSPRYGSWYPWSLPVQTMGEGSDVGRILAFSAIAAVLVTLAGLWEFRRSDHD